MWIESAKICILNEVLNQDESQSSVSPAVSIQMLDLHVGLNIDGIILCLLMWLDLDLLGEIT